MLFNALEFLRKPFTPESETEAAIKDVIHARATTLVAAFSVAESFANYRREQRPPVTLPGGALELFKSKEDESRRLAQERPVLKAVTPSATTIEGMPTPSLEEGAIILEDDSIDPRYWDRLAQTSSAEELSPLEQARRDVAAVAVSGEGVTFTASDLEAAA